MLHYKAQIYCMFVIAILFLMCWIGIKRRDKENKIFNTLLIVAFANMCFDIASNYTVNHLDAVHVVVNRVIHHCFFLSLTTMFLLVYKYLVALIEKELEKNLRGRILSYLPYIVTFVLVIFLPVYYMENEGGNYSYGPGPNMVYACVVIYVILIVELIIRHRRNISGKNKVAIILALVCELGAALFQLFVPVALTSSLGVTLFCLCMYMTVANPDAVLVGLLKEETARADRANRAKSDFLAKMSHEIRTPINAVLGMNELILRESSEPEVKKYAKDIKGSARTLLSIINEILDSAKIESGKMEIIPDNYEISSLLNDLYNMIGVKAKDKDLKLVFDVDSNIPTEYYGDDVRIRQVLVNLLTNAVKYTPAGTVTMTLTGRVDGENAILCYSVKDTGIGIKKEDIERLFSEFQRIDENRNRYIEGTGLGMNITVQLLRMMGSELVVQSEYGRGSEFSFEILQKIVNPEPLGDFKERILRGASENEYQSDFTAPDAKILVVDDNAMNLKVFQGLLKQSQMQVYEAESGSGCLELVQQQKFDIIFLDYMMPEMDGVETLHAMRDLGLCMDTPVIMLTANAVTGAKEKYLSEGFDDFLSKPIIPDKLDDMILKYLSPELVQKGDDSEQTRQSEEREALPELDEFDFEYALNLLKSEELLRRTLADFQGFLGTLSPKLSLLCDSITREEALTQYRIEVHALKSTSATVGALLLSKLARILEVAAQNKDIERILLLHPILTEEMEKHRQRIATIFSKEEGKEEMGNRDEVKAYFEMLKNNLENEDYNTADYIFGEINKYRYPDEIQQRMTLLAEQIMNLEAEDAVQTIAEIKAVL